MLRYFIRKARRQGYRARPRVLVAVPGSITPVERRAVFNSAERAGASRVFIMSEAKAAAIGAALPIAEPVASMICDIGGGTTEVAVLSLGDIVASQSIRVAGNSMDRAIQDYLKRHYSLRISTAAAEQLRIDIGSASPLEDELSDEVRGVDTIGGLPRKATITSEEVREALAVPLEQIVEAIKATLDDCGTELASDLVDNGLVLAGGGSLLRSLDRFLGEQTGLPTRVTDDPLAAVARGTYICMEHFDRWRSAMHSSDDDV
jgi:rod shape-determining protein MreB